jgi:hypothetical protein
MKSLDLEPQVQKSLSALRGLGLRLSVDKINEDWVAVAISIDSIINAIRNLMEKNIRWKQHIIIKDVEHGFLVVHFWRGEKPRQLEMMLKI